MHGGKRQGAGRPACPDERKRPVTLKLAPELVAYLATVSNKTAAVEDALRRSRGFREWAKRSSGDSLGDSAAS